VATWPDLKQYIESKYKISDDSGNVVTMLFNFNDGRSQFVTVSYWTSNKGAEWVNVDSPVGKFTEVDIAKAVRMTEGMVCGAISAIGDFLTFRDSFPLMNLDINEFEEPLHLVTGTADELERALTAGGDAL